MEPSSGQNSPRNRNDSQAQILPEEAQENDPAAPEGTSANNSAEPTESVESRVAQADESQPNGSNIEPSKTNPETVSYESKETNTEDGINVGAPRKTLPVVLTFAARGRPRQPFFGTTPTPASTSTGRPAPSDRPTGRPTAGRPIPPPPSYYQNSPQPQAQTAVQEQPQAKQPQPKQKPEHQYMFPDNVDPLLNPMVNPFTNIVAWAPYPTKIAPNVPAHLAHLVEAEVVFVVQHMEAIEYFANLDLPNVYFIQNDKGESIYYVYESTFLEVYSPPSVPIGAVVKQFHPCREQFNILDADENLIFKIYGDCSLMYCSRCMQYDFSIRALDPNETEVGFIRRDFPGMYQFLLGTEYYGVSFPVNMDVRMKAVFLGALFLIDFLYFE